MCQPICGTTTPNAGAIEPTLTAAVEMDRRTWAVRPQLSISAGAAAGARYDDRRSDPSRTSAARSASRNDTFGSASGSTRRISASATSAGTPRCRAA